MAQTNTLVRESVSYLGEETTLGTLPAGSGLKSMQAIILPTDALMVDGLSTEMLANPDEGPRRMYKPDDIVGLQKGSKFSLKTQVKPILAANILEAAASLVNLPHRIFFRHAFGAEHAAAGQSVTAGASTTEFTVTSAAAFVKGTWILVSSDGTATPEACRIDEIATNTLTVSPALSFTPSNASEVRQLYNYAPAESHVATTLSFQRAFTGDATAQYELRGCYGGLKLEWEYGKVPTLTLDGTAIQYQRGALSLTTTAATDDMAAPAIFAPSIYLLNKSAGARAGIARATRYACESFSLELPVAWEEVRDGGAAGTVAALVNTAGRGGIKCSIKARFDGAATTSPPALFDSRDPLEAVMIWQQAGTGYTGASAARFMVVDLPCARVMAEPKPITIGARLGHELVLEAYEDDAMPTTPAGSPIIGTDDDFFYAPVRLAWG